MKQLAVRMSSIQPFHVMALLARARELEAAGRSIVHMEIGEPDFVTPQPVIDARVLQGSLEESNVNSVIELTKMISIHRTYAANQRLLQEEHQRVRRAITTLTAPPRN